ncbi:MAG: SusD/RagB family nutrient-binding outer membrane lipoprotein, partial [Chitinophagaceae bacterium]
QVWWGRFYRDILVDLKEAKRLIAADITLAEATRKNQTAIADIMQVYTYTILINTFGDIPYTEALDYTILNPKYDDSKTVSDDLFSRLNADIAALNVAGSGFDAKSDLVYGNIASETARVNAWVKFANALKIRMAMVIVDADAAKSKTAVEEADQKAFTSATDNALFLYSKTTPNTNPIWVDLIQSNRQDFIAGSTLVNKLKSLNDPRLSLFFKPNDAGVYEGGTLGSNNTFSNYAKVSDRVTAPDFPAILLDYVETEFYRAEAVERGFAITGSAAAHYNNAIRASILYWGGTNAMADDYLLKPEVAYATATGNYKEKIGTQKWIALNNRGYEAWLEVRRLDYPKLVAPATAKSGFPNRFAYPSNEQTLNKANYTDAAAKVGGDKVETKLFWDKN